MSLDVLPFGLAHAMGIVPLFWCVALTATGRRLSGLHWWLALAFGVSWVADWATHWYSPVSVGIVYPLVQSGMILVVLAPTARAGLLTTIGLATLGAIWWRGLPAADLLPRTVAWLATVALVWPRRDLGAIREALLIAFGLGWVCWVGYHLWPGWTTWGLYQGVRAVSLGWFCWATWKPAEREVVYATQ